MSTEEATTTALRSAPVYVLRYLGSQAAPAKHLKRARVCTTQRMHGKRHLRRHWWRSITTAAALITHANLTVKAKGLQPTRSNVEIKNLHHDN